ncbi:uncharacterized protein LOC115311231 isoform X2 [Ixodes scapularis]|uniref:uncharacterized protein LOC115311231 isoform X2 n=1 Tax=Ixodes scapularis TaxID=6945 RepID=UPI001A9FA833|nr:uncharacterized protein LOC115311231 isoform X2 [Ixodes scapularis]
MEGRGVGGQFFAKRNNIAGVTRPMSDDDEEAVLQKYVKYLDKVGESWTGHLEKEDLLEPMERELLTIGVSFKTVSSRLPKLESLKSRSTSFLLGQRCCANSPGCAIQGYLEGTEGVSLWQGPAQDPRRRSNFNGRNRPSGTSTDIWKHTLTDAVHPGTVKNVRPH